MQCLIENMCPHLVRLLQQTKLSRFRPSRLTAMVGWGQCLTGDTLAIKKCCLTWLQQQQRRCDAKLAASLYCCYCCFCCCCCSHICFLEKLSWLATMLLQLLNTIINIQFMTCKWYRTSKHLYAQCLFNVYLLSHVDAGTQKKWREALFGAQKIWSKWT